MTRYIKISIYRFRYRYIVSYRQNRYRLFRYIAIFVKYGDIFAHSVVCSLILGSH